MGGKCFVACRIHILAKSEPRARARMFGAEICYISMRANPCMVRPRM